MASGPSTARSDEWPAWVSTSRCWRALANGTAWAGFVAFFRPSRGSLSAIWRQVEKTTTRMCNSSSSLQWRHVHDATSLFHDAATTQTHRHALRCLLVVPASGATMKTPGCQGFRHLSASGIIARYFGWLAAAWPVSDTHMTSWPFRSPVLCRNH